MKGRIKYLRKSMGLTQTEFGRRLGVTTSAISGYELGTISPSDAIIRSICREFGVREEWLRDGAGAMKASEARAQEMGKLIKTLIADRPESFRSALLTTLLRFDPEGPEWDTLEAIYRLVASQMDADAEKEDTPGP